MLRGLNNGRTCGWHLWLSWSSASQSQNGCSSSKHHILAQLHSKQEAESSMGRGPPPLPPSYSGKKNLLPEDLPLHFMDQKLTCLALQPGASPILPEFKWPLPVFVNKEGKSNGFGASNKQSDTVLPSLNYKWGDWTSVRQYNLPKVTASSKWQKKDSKLGIRLFSNPLSNLWLQQSLLLGPNSLCLECSPSFFSFILQICSYDNHTESLNSNFTQDCWGQPLATHL